MAGLVNLLLGYIWNCFQSQERLKAEIVILRHQLNILRRKAPKRPKLSGCDRAVFAWLFRFFPTIAGAITIIRPETVIRWHRAGFRTWWRWKSRNLGAGPRSIANYGISLIVGAKRKLRSFRKPYPGILRLETVSDHD